MSPDPFIGPRLKIDRGRNHICELRDALSDYFGRVQYGFHKTGKSEGHMHEFEFRFSEAPPRDAPLLIGDAAHNLRSALDLLMCDIARHQGKSTDGIRFPFAANAEALETILTKKGEIRRLGSFVTDILRELKPYKGGNIALRGLHDLDVMDKHVTVIPIYQVITVDQQSVRHPSIPMSMGIDVPTPWTEGSPVWLAPGATFEMRQIAPIQALMPPPLPFADKPVLETLENLAELADEIVTRFGTHLGIGPSPSPADPV